MGLFDIFKNKSDQTQQQPAAAPQQAAPAPAPSTPTDPVFQVKFGEKIPYYDPEIVMIEIGYSGVAEVRCEGRTGEDNDIQYVRRQILIFMEEELRKIADEGTAVLMVTHNLDSATSADGNYVMKNGQLGRNKK